MVDPVDLAKFGNQPVPSTDKQARYISAYKEAYELVVTGLAKSLHAMREFNPGFAEVSSPTLVKLFAPFKPIGGNLPNFYLLHDLEQAPQTETSFFPNTIGLHREIPHAQLTQFIEDTNQWMQGGLRLFSRDYSSGPNPPVAVTYNLHASRNNIVEFLHISRCDTPNHTTTISYDSKVVYEGKPQMRHDINQALAEFDLTESGDGGLPIGHIRLWLMNRALSELKRKSDKREGNAGTLVGRLLKL